MVLLPQSSEDNELLFKALLTQFKETSQYLINQAGLYVIYIAYLSILHFYDKGIDYILYRLYNIHSQLHCKYFITST